ncbi:MAG: tyrosine--tRNA ligase [Chlamydiae bacterium]|jgi:tyrosyl-tRNA synthetase|nr:tyrosine--tRNA ligase [Chlamydiota bacterium]
MSETVFDWFLERGFIEQSTSDDLKTILKTPLSFYFGIDPTAESPHLGNWVGILASMKLQKLGHRPIILVGGATGLIGDPSGKDLERPLLSAEVIQKNVDSLTQVLKKFLDFNHPTAAPLIVNNYDWFSKMNMIEFLRDVGKQFRLGTMLAKESVKNRVNSEEGMSFTEFSYQILQGYDFYYLFEKYGVNLQIGGSDQYGNIVAGIDLTRRLSKKTVYGLTFPLLVRSDGKKFGKSEKGAIWLKEELCSPFEMYQYLVRVPDKDVKRMLQMLTLLEMDEINLIVKEIEKTPNLAQKRLAEEVTLLVHGEKGLKEALGATDALSPGKMNFCEEGLTAMQENMPNIELSSSDVLSKPYIDVVVRSGLIESKSEVRRLIQNQGAYLNGKKITDPNFVITKDFLLQENLCVVSAGKKKSVLIRLKF